MTADDGVWLYSITTDSIGDAQLAGVTGVAGEPVRAVTSSGLVAVVGTVSLGEFGQEPLQRKLEDLDWLATTARAHDAVVAAVLRNGPTVPLRLATLYLDDDRVRLLLTERQEEFGATLRRVTGRSEWGVKGYGDAKLLSQDVKEEPSSTGATGKGTAYLLRRRAELSAQQDVERKAAGHAGEIHAALLDQAVDGVRRQVTDPVLTGKRAWMIFNGTYLVDNDRVDGFTALVTALDAERPGITLELTGPWPPYSFAGIDG